MEKTVLVHCVILSAVCSLGEAVVMMRAVNLLCLKRRFKRRRRRRLWRLWTCFRTPRRQGTMPHLKMIITGSEVLRRTRRRDRMAPTPPLPVTEDTPPDMLAGSMDLRVVLPNGHSVKMSVDRSTPMMDLLVQVTTMNKISTGGHILQAIGERGILPYKPSTPIGALDTWTIQVVPKSKVQTTTVQKKAPLKPLSQQQPFEQTFRLQVHLPRNQLYVMRVSPRTLLSDILRQTCKEKNLDPNKYELRHPANISQLLIPSCTLADYGLQEVTVAARSHAPRVGSALLSSDIMALQQEEDIRCQQSKCEGSISSDSLGGRSISPARSDESASRSASPPAPNLPPMMAPIPPARPARKRRPAPKPPGSNIGPVSNKQQTELNTQAESSTGTVVNGHSGSDNGKTAHVAVSHSRNSSDSSGYHEASVLSEGPAEGHPISENGIADSVSHHEKLTSTQPAQMKAQVGNYGLSRSMSNLTGVGSMGDCQRSTSNTSLASSTGQGQKKKKAPPPPPGTGGTKDRQQQKHPSSLSLSSNDQDVADPHNKTTSLERHLSGKSSVVGSAQSSDKCSSLPGKMKMSQHDYRPAEPPTQKSENAAETEAMSPEERRLDSDQIPEVEEDTAITRQDERNTAARSQISGDSSDIQDESFQTLPLPPVESAPPPHVELASRSKSHQVVDPSTPEASATLKQPLTLHTPVPKPRVCIERSLGDDTTPSVRKRPIPPPRQMSDSSNVQGERHKQTAKEEKSDGGQKMKVKNGSTGRTFGVGTTMLMMSQSGTDSISSGSWEWQSLRSQSPADNGPDSDDDLSIADKDMEIFDMMTETSEASGTVQARNKTRGNTSTVNHQVMDSYDDSESLSLASSVFDYDSEHESSEASSTLKCPPLERLLRTKGEKSFHASKEVNLHDTDRNGQQGKNVGPKISGGSSASVWSVDEVPSRNNSMGRWTNRKAPASKQSLVLGYNSDAETGDPIDQVVEAFSSVTAELEAAIKRDEELGTQLPPPAPAEDLTVDWEYLLPAPPSAFRDSDSPTFSEGRTVLLADTQVFQEPSSPEPEPDFRQGRSAITKHKDSLDTRFSSPLHRNEVTRTNPLFDPNQYDDDDPGDSNINPSAVCEDGTKKLKHDTKHLYHTEATLHKQDSSELLLMKPDSSRDQSTRKGGELSNFTITTYQRPHDPDGLFGRDGDNNAAEPVQHLSTDTRKKPTTVFQHKYSSTDSLNSSGGVGSATSVSRTNSFNSNDSSMFKIPGPVSTSSVKRSTSYISLVAKPPSFPGNGFQSGRTYAPYSNRTKSVGNLAVEAQLDADDETAYENWGLGKMRKCSVSHDPSESVQKGIESQTTAEKQKMARGTEVGHEEQRGSQQQIIITEEERARLLALQEQFLQLQEQLLQNSGHMQQISQTHAPAADTPLQSLQVLRSILPQLNQTKMSGCQETSQQQNSENSAFLRSETHPTELVPKGAEDFVNNQSVKLTTSSTLKRQNSNEKESSDNTGEMKRYTYRGPPAISFATWSERPKSQVSIKMDRDYRIGVGQGGRTIEHGETPSRTVMSESKDDTSAVKSNHHTETSRLSEYDDKEANAQNKSNNKVTNSQATKTDPGSLTMRLISHTTPSGFRKPVTGGSQKFMSSYAAGEGQQSYTSEAKEVTGSSTVGMQVGSTQQSDPSRVPIVRAVELKKSFIQQQNPRNVRSSTTELNGEESRGLCSTNIVDQRNGTDNHNGRSDAETFAGVNFLAKRFSNAGLSQNGPHSLRSSRPLSSYGKVETADTKGRDNTTNLPYNGNLSYKSVSSTNLNALNVNTRQDAQLRDRDATVNRRYTSVVGINNDSERPSSSFQELASESSRVQSRVSGPSVVRVNGMTAPKQLMPVVKGFQFASPAANKDTSPPLAAKSLKNSNTTNAHNPKVHRSESTSAIRTWKTVDVPDHTSDTSFGSIKTYMRRSSNDTRPEPVVMKVKTDTESEPPLPPPLAVSLQKSTSRPRPRTRPGPELNPRDQLMDAIRNFGGRENLKQSGCS
ncbi:uncharacterized protein LOC110830321 isoform X3 [Zootermopsis nevadensis]|nr:uncharacterized protein LOC110830321 isoform X3 [Zootermopsis nevadensis]